MPRLPSIRTFCAHHPPSCPSAERSALGPSPGEVSVGGNPGSGDAQASDGVSTGKRKAASAAEDSAEVRPYPGLVDGLDDLMSDDDHIASVACGARYTLALSEKKRAFVWGQVAPSADGGGGGTGYRSNRGIDTNVPSSFSRPRELIPAELLRAAAAAESTGSDHTVQCCCSRGGEDNDGVSQGGGTDVVIEESRWRVSTVGCGPWYVVLGLEEEGPKGKDGQVS